MLLLLSPNTALVWSLVGAQHGRPSFFFEPRARVGDLTDSCCARAWYERMALRGAQRPRTVLKTHP